MIEVTTEAIVLEKEDSGEQDSRIFLFTKDFGKLSAKATSARKITSKLAGHLEPLNYVTARLVSRFDFLDSRSVQVIDALLIDNAGVLKSDPVNLRKAVEVLNLIRQSIPDGVPDKDLWQVLQDLRCQKFSYGFQEVLNLLGFDSAFASCELCQKSQPEYFYPRSQFFVCQFCSLNSQDNRKQLIKIV